MTNNKKISLIALGFIGAFSIFSGVRFANSPIDAYADEKKVEISCTDFQVIQGDTFTTTIYLAEDANLIDFDIHLKYDTDKLTLVNAAENEDIKGSIIYNVDTKGEIDVNYTRTNNNVNKQTSLLDLTFVVSEYVAPGSYDCLTVDYNQTYIAHTLSGTTLQPIDFVCEFAPLNIYEMGDVDLNGKVDIGDATYIRRSLAKLTDLSEFQLSLADTYYDGVIDIADAVNLQRYLAKMDILYGNRVLVNFYNKDGEFAFARSVVRGEDLEIVPNLPVENGYINGVWSLNKNLYQEVDFNNITEGFSVYAMYEQEHTDQMNYYRDYVNSFISELNGKVQGDVVLPKNISYPTDLSYTAVIIWTVSNANLFSREGKFTQPTYGTEFTLTANIYSYHNGESIETPITEEYSLFAVGVYGTPSKSEIAEYLRVVTDGVLSEDGKSSVTGGVIENDLKLIRKISNEQVNAETPYEVHIDWEIEKGSNWEPISQIQRKVAEQTVNLRATITFNGKPLEGDGVVYFYEVKLTAVTEEEVRNYVIDQIAANTVMPIKNGAHLWDTDSKYGCNVSWSTNNTNVIKAIDSKNNVTVNENAVNGQTCVITVTVAIADINFSLKYTVAVETNNTALVAGTNIDESLYYALRNELDVKILTTEALKNTKFVQLDLSKYNEPFEGGDGNIHPAITNLKGLSYCENLFLLNISGLHIEEGLAEISSLSKLESLIAIDCGVSSLNDGGLPVLSNATHLKVIDLSHNKFETLDSVLSAEKTYSNLKEVYLNDNLLTDIEVLQNAPLLEKAVLSNNKLENSAMITIGLLSNLKYLSLANNEISDISLMSSLTALQELRLQNNSISNVDSLKDLIAMERLYLGDNNISSIKNLKNLTKVEVLYLNNNTIRNIDAVGSMKTLRVLNITNNEITSCDALEDLSPNEDYSGLVELYAENNQISSFAFVEKLTGLKKLLLSNNAAENESKYLTRYLSDLNSLEELSLSGTKVNSLDFLENEDETYKPIIRLELSNCELPSAYLTQVTTVSQEDGGGNVHLVKQVMEYVDNFKLLSNLNKTLKYLDISNNNFDTDFSEYSFSDEEPTTIEELGFLNKLQVLYADNNSISNNIDGLVKRMRRLEYVSFENCGIRTSDWLNLSDYYHYVDLANNPIEEFDYIYLGNSIETLEYLYLDSTAENAELTVLNADAFEGNIIKELSLNNLNIGEIKAIPDMDHIEYLNLVNTNITDFVGPIEDDEYIYSISRFKNLKHLDIAEKNVNIFTKNNLELLYNNFGSEYVNLYLEEQLPTGYSIDGRLNSQKEAARILNLIDNMVIDGEPLNLWVATEGISDNNPILSRDVFGYEITWRSQDNHYSADGEKLALLSLDEIKDDVIILSAKVNSIYDSQNTAEKNFEVLTHIVRLNKNNIKVNKDNVDEDHLEIGRNIVFTYSAEIVPSFNVHFNENVTPVNYSISYAESTNASGKTWNDMVTSQGARNFVVKNDAPLGAILSLEFQVKCADDSSSDYKEQINLTIIAQQYKLSFNANGGIVKNSSGSEVKSLQLREESEIKFTATKKGYDTITDLGYTDNTYTSQFPSKMPSKDSIIYLKWNPKKYTITYKANGGKITEQNSTSYTVESIPMLATVEYDTYPEYNHFIGWYLDSEYKTPYSWENLVNNPRNITLYAKWDLCQEYSSIDTTPWTVGYRTIIDWRNETDQNMLNHTARTVISNRFDNIDIANNATEIIFIGKPEQVFNNLVLHICCFAENQKLTIRFVNFNYVSDMDGAIRFYEDQGVDLTIDVVGNCSMASSVNSGSVIGTSEHQPKYLAIIGSGDLTLTAGNGASATSAGASGGAGGTAVYADNIKIDISGNLTVTGGNGGNGAKGKDQSLEHNASNAPATATTDGGKGGNGGKAFQCSKISILDVSKVRLFGGNGGKGGNGGSAGDGYGGYKNEIGILKAGSYDGYADLPDGANGGDGGDGGAPINQDASIIISQKSDLYLRFGNGGNGGNGGQGGDAAWPDNGVKPDGKGHGGNAGKGGNGYNGGTSGIGGNGGSSFTNYTSGWWGSKEDQIGTTGDGGSGNSGGNAIATIIYKNGIKTSEYGLAGSGGRGGYCGASSGASNGKSVKYGTDRSSSVGANGIQVESNYNATWLL